MMENVAQRSYPAIFVEAINLLAAFTAMRTRYCHIICTIFKMNFEFVIAAAAIQGFTTQNGGFILRELTLIFPIEQEQHFQFKNPETIYLNPDEMKIAKFSQRHLNGFSPTDNESCCLSAAVYPKILEEIQHCRIYCAGETEPDTKVIDVYSLIDFNYPTQLQLDDPSCFKLHRYRYCSLAKARYLTQKLDGFRL